MIYYPLAAFLGVIAFAFILLRLFFRFKKSFNRYVELETKSFKRILWNYNHACNVTPKDLQRDIINHDECLEHIGVILIDMKIPCRHCKLGRIGGKLNRCNHGFSGTITPCLKECREFRAIDWKSGINKRFEDYAWEAWTKHIRNPERILFLAKEEKADAA